MKETKLSVLYDTSSAIEQVLMFIGEQKKIFSTPEIENSSLVFQFVVWLLYRLRYPASKEIMKEGKK